MSQAPATSIPKSILLWSGADVRRMQNLNRFGICGISIAIYRGARARGLWLASINKYDIPKLFYRNDHSPRDYSA